MTKEHHPDDSMMVAEIFEAISHPTRIRILFILKKGDSGFSELKHRLGISSSGTLQHHLNKLTSLLVINETGKYALTDQGLEAIYAIKSAQNLTNTTRTSAKVTTVIIAFSFYIVQMNLPFIMGTVDALTPIYALLGALVFAVIFYPAWIVMSDRRTEQPKNNDVIYYEMNRIKARWFYWLLGGVTVADALLTAMFALLIPSAGLPALFATVLLLLGACFLVFMVVNYRHLVISISIEALSVGYRFVNHKQIPITNIRNCEITQATLRSHGGLGVRYCGDGIWAYLTFFGTAVKIVSKEGTAFIFSSLNPEKICDIIQQLTQEKS